MEDVVALYSCAGNLQILYLCTPVHSVAGVHPAPFEWKTASLAQLVEQLIRN